MKLYCIDEFDKYGKYLHSFYKPFNTADEAFIFCNQKIVETDNYYLFNEELSNERKEFY